MSYIEVDQEHVYLVSTVDQDEKKAFVTFDFNEAGKKYAELKVKGDAIIWHVKTKDLDKRILNDFERPIEIVDDERLLRILSILLIDDNPKKEWIFGNRIMELFDEFNVDVNEYFSEINHLENFLEEIIRFSFEEDIPFYISKRILTTQKTYGISRDAIIKEFRQIMDEMINDEHHNYSINSIKKLASKHLRYVISVKSYISTFVRFNPSFFTTDDEIYIDYAEASKMKQHIPVGKKHFFRILESSYGIKPTITENGRIWVGLRPNIGNGKLEVTDEEDHKKESKDKFNIKTLVDEWNEKQDKINKSSESKSIDISDYDDLHDGFRRWLEENGYKNRGDGNYNHGYLISATHLFELATTTSRDVKKDRSILMNAFPGYLREKGLTNSSVKYNVTGMYRFYDFIDGIEVSGEKEHFIVDISDYNNMVEGFTKWLEKKGYKDKRDRKGFNHTYISYARSIIEFALRTSRDLIKDKDVLMEEFENYLRKKGTNKRSTGTNMTGIRAFYRYLDDESVREQIPSKTRSPGKIPSIWAVKITGDEEIKTDISYKVGKRTISAYSDIIKKMVDEIGRRGSMSHSEIAKYLGNIKGSTPSALMGLVYRHLDHLLYKGIVERINRRYVLVDDDGINVESPQPTRESIEEEMNTDYYIKRITSEDPYTWISRGSISDTEEVKRGQGPPIYSEINRRIMVELRVSKISLKISEIVRDTMNLEQKRSIPETARLIVYDHIRYLVYKNRVRRVTRGYYESVPETVPEYTIDLIAERKIHESVMDKTTRK